MSRIATLDASKSGRPALADFDVTVSSNLSSCRHAWASLQGRAITTAFQSFDWLDSWQRHVGAAAGVQPVIVTGCRSDGKTAFILPFGLVRKRGCTVLTWLSYPHSNYGYAVYDETFLERDVADFERIWTRILALLPKLDAIALSDQPARVQHYENPFLQLKTCASADRSYILDLDKPFDALLREKFSSRTRRRLAQHERRMDEDSLWRKVDATSAADIELATNAMFSQKRRQLARRGITDPFSTAFEAFIRTLVACERDSERTVRCYYLECDGEIIATNFGAVENGTYFGLVTTMDEGRYSRLSPGAITMNHAIARSCEEGLATFDFSAGAADYKDRWADRSVELFETHMALTLSGHVYCLMERARIRLKRRIKHSPRLWKAVKLLRSIRAGSRCAAVF